MMRACSIATITLLCAASSASAQAPKEEDAPPITVQVKKDDGTVARTVEIPSRSAKSRRIAEIIRSGEEEHGGGGTGGSTTASAASHHPVPDVESKLPPWLFYLSGAIVACCLLLVAGVLLNTYVLVPRRRRAPLLRAYGLLESDGSEDLKTAEDIINDALAVGGLRAADIADAKFALSYVRIRRGDLDGASTSVAELRRTSTDAETLYLDLWLKHQRGHHEEVLRIYDQFNDVLADFNDSRLAAGIAAATRARQLWHNREFKEAVQYFERLRSIGVLLDEIPARLYDHQVVLGTKALYQGDVEEARGLFSSAIESARAGNRPDFRGRLGLILCDWKSRELEERGALFEELHRISMETLEAAPHVGGVRATCKCTACAETYLVWPAYAEKTLRCPACAATFVVELVEESVGGDDTPGLVLETPPPADANPDLEVTEDLETDDELQLEEVTSRVLLSEDDRLLLNLLHWRAAAYVHRWLRRSPSEQLDVTYFRELVQSAESVSAEVAEIVMLEGLVLYLLSETAELKREGFARLERAVQLGVSEPGVLNLIESESSRRRLAARLDESLRWYAEHPSMQPALRERLRQRMRFAPWAKTLPEIHPNDDARAAAPTTLFRVREVKLGELLEQLEATGKMDEMELQEIGTQFRARTKELHSRSTSFEELEDRVVMHAAELRFREEERPDLHDTRGRPSEGVS